MSPVWLIMAPLHKQKNYIFFIFLIWIKKFLSDSLFHMHIDMGDRIVGKQDRPNLIIEAPPPRPPGPLK